MLKVKLKDWPGERVGELSKLPESEVTVCATLSLLVQVTVVPARIFNVAGLKEKLLMLTETFEVTSGEFWLVEGLKVGELEVGVFPRGDCKTFTCVLPDFPLEKIK